jgi:UDP-glucose 4-epimerase
MTLQRTRVLVTGGSGFIGSHLVTRLLAEEADVAVTVRYGNVVKCERLRWCWDRLRVFEADLRNRGAWEGVRAFQPEIVVHLAAYNDVGQSFQQVEECFDVNAKGTANLVDLFGDARRFVYVSTSEVYGLQTDVPFTERMEPQPISPYAITKYAGELYCRMKQRMEANGRTILIRPFNAYGPYQSSKAIIPELILNGLRNIPIECTAGEQTREFNFVEDLVDGLLRASTLERSVEGPINLAAGQEIAIRDLVLLIAKLTGTSVQPRIGALPYRPTEIWRMRGDNQRARELLGWEPRTSIEEGLGKTVAWFRARCSQKDALPEIETLT